MQMESTQLPPALGGLSPMWHVRGRLQGSRAGPYFSCTLRKPLLVPKEEAVKQQTEAKQRAAKQNNPPWLGKSNKSEVLPNFGKRCQIRSPFVHRRDCCQVAKKQKYEHLHLRNFYCL